MCQHPPKIPHGGCCFLQTLQLRLKNGSATSAAQFHCSQTAFGWVCQEALKTNSGLILGLSAFSSLSP